MNCRGAFSVPFRLLSFSSCLRSKFMAGSSIKKTIKLESTSEPVPVETDTQKIATHLCGSNLLAEGGEDIKLKPDSEYPDWLWEIRSPPPLRLLSKDSKTYWNRIRRYREHERKYLRKFNRTATVHK